VSENLAERAPIFQSLRQIWREWRNGNKTVVIDTITTRFFLLFLFLLSIPLISVIIFTVSLLVNHLDEASTLQLTLSQHLVEGELANAAEKLNFLADKTDLSAVSGTMNRLPCSILHVKDCLLLDTERQTVLSSGGAPLKWMPVRQFSNDLAALDLKTNGLQSFYTKLGHQIYLFWRNDDRTGQPRDKVLLGLPLDATFFNHIYAQQPNLQPEIWVVADGASSGPGKLILRAHNAQQDNVIPVNFLLKSIYEAQAIPSQAVRIKVDEIPYLVMQDILYDQDNHRIGRLLYVLPLIRNQLLLSNYYLGIYIIAVASLIFSVLLAMVAGRTITQPLLKLIQQVNMLSRETVAKDDSEIIITGVYEIQQLGAAFSRMLKRLYQEHKMRDDFVATLTHDLKVPLLAEKQTLIYMRNQTYGPVTDEQSEVLDSLQSSNRSCLSLVSGLLEVYRYDAGEVALVFDSFNMVSLLSEVAGEFQAMAKDKLIQMEVESTIPVSHEEAMVFADRLEIKRVLGNLISNAIINTPKHGNIRCKITNAEYYGGDTIYKVSSFQHTSLKYPIKLMDRLLVSIQDSGLGFSSQDLTALFKQFTANKSRNPMSIGLGLYNCHQVLKAHHGVVWVESTEGEGSLVSFILPQNKAAAQDRRVFRDRRRHS